MDQLEGIWRLVDSRAWVEGASDWSVPYGANPVGQITFSNGRMLAVLCNGDADAGALGKRNYSSYGGPYSFDGTTLDTHVDVAADASRIGGHQIRAVEMKGEQMVLRPPQRLYGNSMERREIIWERIWQP